METLRQLEAQAPSRDSQRLPDDGRGLGRGILPPKEKGIDCGHAAAPLEAAPASSAPDFFPIPRLQQREIGFIARFTPATLGGLV